MFGCENFLNLWAPATLIAGGMMAQGSIGSLRTLKFFGLCFGASYGFMSAFGPSNGTGIASRLALYNKLGLNITSNDVNGNYLCGCDSMALGLSTLMLARLMGLPIALGAFAGGLAYYGPQGVGGQSAAIAYALFCL